MPSPASSTSTNPDVLHDLQPEAPCRGPLFGLVTEALRRRRERGLSPFTVMSCDNLQGNGHVASQVFTAFARLTESRNSATWFEREASSSPTPWSTASRR